MDIATLIGLVVGLGLVVSAMAMGGSVLAFVNGPGILIVFGGTFAALFTHQKMKHVLGAFAVAGNAFFDRLQPAEDLIPLIVQLSTKARKEGLVSLEGEPIDDPFLARGVRLGVDGLSPETIKATLLAELAALKQRHQRGQKIWRFLGSTAPAMGMIGTLVGLVQMLREMDDPDAIGPAMAVALLTTLYGAIFAFLVANPIADKLEARTAEEVAQRSLAMVGVESILRGDNTIVIQSKLESFLPPASRAKDDDK